MKTFLLCTLCFLASLVKAQSTAINNNVKVTFSSYNTTFHVLVLDVVNTSDCDSVLLKFRWPDHPDSTIKLHRGYVGQVILPFSGGDVKIEFKTTANCNVQSNGPWSAITMKALALPDNLTYKKTADGIALFFSKGEVLKSVDGLQFVSQGTQESVWFDRLPEAKNYYRVKFENGTFSPIVYVAFDIYKGEPYKVYNRLGQRIAVTYDLNPYRWKREYLIIK